jgi:tRNA pseudouridine65 synthase
MTDPPARLGVLHRDERLLIVDKPSGLAVHRGWADDRVTAVSLARELAGRDVHPIHRLDRGTSGVLVFALDADTARALGEELQAGRVEKTYLAAVRGVPPEAGVIDHPVPRGESGAGTDRVPAVTEYRRLFVFAHRSLLEVRPRTGRLHQIRRHLKHISHPVLGDSNYGKGALNRELRATVGLARLALHASSITIEGLCVRAPVPADLPLALLFPGYDDGHGQALGSGGGGAQGGPRE